MVDGGPENVREKDQECLLTVESKHLRECRDSERIWGVKWTTLGAGK